MEPKLGVVRFGEYAPMESCISEASILDGVASVAAPRLHERRPGGAGARVIGAYSFAVLDLLPAAVYLTDKAGRITYFNEAATALWGFRPELGTSQWCGSWKLQWPDGTPLPHNQCPMAIAIKERRPVRGLEAVALRPDGTQVPFLAFPTPLFDERGEFIGAINMLVDVTDRNQANTYAERLAAIVQSTDDAIISKDLNGIITSWNRGAELLFGYSAAEMIGKPITVIIPADHLDEETEILSRIGRGERMEHYETIRRRKDGTLIEISITVSPLKTVSGKIVGGIQDRPRHHRAQTRSAAAEAAAERDEAPDEEHARDRAGGGDAEHAERQPRRARDLHRTRAGAGQSP
jgi:PAS domain S-box-containing protein